MKLVHFLGLLWCILMKTEIHVAHVTDYIQDLIERNLLSDAIQYIHVFELVGKFPPVSILKSYLNDSKWRVFKKEKNPHLREVNLDDPLLQCPL